MQSVPKPETTDNGFVYRTPEIDYPEVAPKPETPRWMHREPPFLHSLKWHDPETGIKRLTVVRATDVADMWHKVKQVVSMVKVVCERHDKATPEAAETPASARPDWCPVHKVTMKASKDGDGYFHKAGQKPAGKAVWCRGK